MSDHVDWQMAIEHYMWDRLQPAYELAVNLGVGLAGRYERMYRMIEAEYRTREHAEIEEVNDWLSVEKIPFETDGSEEMAEAILRAAQSVSERLGCRESFKTRVAVMALEVDAPWTEGRAGYQTSKHPYDKICIPNQVVFDPHQVERLIHHEYTHVIASNLSEGRVPRWLQEAMAVTMERSHDLDLRRQFANGQLPWLDVHDLALAFVAEDEGVQDYKTIRLAYEQAGWIGAYLASLEGEHRLGDLMRGFANNSVWKEMLILMKGEPPEEEAMQEVYHLTLQQLFAKSLEWLQQGGGIDQRLAHQQ